MTIYLTFLVVGLGTGAVYAALAMGLVAVHKGTGFINFAQGAMAMWGAYVFDEVRRNGQLVLPIGTIPISDSFSVAFLCGTLSAAVLALLVYLLVFRPLQGKPPLAKIVASVGVMIALPALVVLRFSADSRRVAPILPTEVVQWGSVTFSRDRLYLTGIAVLIAVVLWSYFRFTRIGLAARASSENEVAASLSGYSPSVLAGTTWVLTCTLVGIMAILAAPADVMAPTNLTLLVVPALAVALLAKLRSIPIACVGGLVLGALQSEVNLLTSRSWWPEWAATGLGDALPFVVIVGVLFFSGRRLPSRGVAEGGMLPPVVRSRARPGVVVALVAVGGLALVLTSGSYRFAVVTSMIFAILALSLVVLTGLAGQLSLAQVALAGASGFALSKLTTDWNVPFPLSIFLSAGVATVLGVLIGIPALRIRGAQLTVVTLAGAVVLEKMLFRNPSFVPVAGNKIAPPSLFGLDLSVRSGTDLVRLPFALMVLAVLVACAIAVGNLTRSDTGKALLAVRSNERAAAAAGIDVARAKLLAFALSAFLAGLGGALIGYSRGQLSADSFGVFVGLSLLAFVYLGGITSVGGALIAGISAPLGLAYVFLDRYVDLGKYYSVAFALLLVYAAISSPSGAFGGIHERRIARERRRAADASADGSPDGSPDGSASGLPEKVADAPPRSGAAGESVEVSGAT